MARQERIALPGRFISGTHSGEVDSGGAIPLLPR